MATSAMCARALALLAVVVVTQSLTMDEGESNAYIHFLHIISIYEKNNAANK